MSNPVRRASLGSSVLLLCAAGSCHVGDWQSQQETEQLDKWMEATGFYISHVEPDTNVWQILGFLLLFAGISFAIAAFMLARRGTD